MGFEWKFHSHGQAWCSPLTLTKVRSVLYKDEKYLNLMGKRSAIYLLFVGRS